MPADSENGWRQVKLKDVCREITVGHVGPMASEYVEEGIPFFRSQNIQPFRVDLTDIKYIRPKFHQKLRKSAVSPGDVLVVRTGYPGTACVLPKDVPIANCADLVIIRPSPDLDPWFLASLFNSAWGRGTVSGSLVGVAQQHFNIGVAREMVITLPPISTQRKVTSMLSAYDDLIENNTRRIKILEEMARAIYREWFVHFRFPGHEKVKKVDSSLGEIPEGWEAKMLGDLAQEMRLSIKPDEIDPETPYFGLEHLPRRSIALSEWETAKDVQSTKLAFKEGDILFGKIRPYFHKVGIAPLNGVCSSDTIVIRSKAPEYFAVVLCCVSSDAFVAHATQTSQGTKMPRANWHVLSKHPIALPQAHLLWQFNGFVEEIVAQIHTTIFRNRVLRRTRDLLLPKLISGEIDVGTKNGQSAAVAMRLA